MMNMNYLLPFAALGFLWQQAGENPEPSPKQVPVEVTPVVEVGAASPVLPVPAPRDIDLALCLDTSGSMSGLIDSAKQKLWALVNDLALAEPTPRIRVALLTYGTPEFGADSGFVQTALQLTEDLDMVSLRLFELTTNGGDEYVGRVTRTATNGLAWSAEPNALKMIVVAGNESAEQDPLVTLEVACGEAIQKGIVVHALYCDETGQGAQTRGASTNTIPQTIASATPASAPVPAAAVAQPLSAIALGWKKVSLLADGAFAMIQTENGAPVIETPFDTVLVDLSSQLNGTYIPYGAGSDWNLANQVAQDSNATGLNNDAAAGRAMSKGGKLYVCSWDLLDSLANASVKFEDIDYTLLPEALREFTEAELNAHVDDKREARTKVQAEIAAAGEKREAWLVSKRAELGTDESTAFDSPLRKAFRELAEARGFKFAAPKVAVAPAPDHETQTEESPVQELHPTPGK